MTRVYTSVARKDYPEQGIKKGDTYYKWTPGFRGREQKSKTYPRPSQLTANGNKQQALQVIEALEDAIAAAESPADVEAAFDDAADGAREAGDAFRESFDNMPEGLQQGDTGQALETNADNLDSFADECESAFSDLDDADDWDKWNDEQKEEWLEAARSAAGDLSFDLE